MQSIMDTLGVGALVATVAIHSVALVPQLDCCCGLVIAMFSTSELDVMTATSR